MPKLKSRDAHDCLVCGFSFKRRDGLRDHLTLPKASDKKPRCSGLKRAMTADVWLHQVLPLYTSNAPLPDLGQFLKVKKSPGSPYLISVKISLNTPKLS